MFLGFMLLDKDAVSEPEDEILLCNVGVHV